MRPERSVAIISGAGAGIGAETARVLARDGFDLALGARRVETVRALAEELAQSHGIRTFAGFLDVRDESSVLKFVDSAVSALGALHVLVNNAGMARGVDRLEVVPGERVEEMFETNVYGAIRMIQAVLPHMRSAGWGHIVNVGSIAGHGVYEGGGVYCGTKHALEAFTGTLRLELCGEPIRIGTVDPGMVETEFSRVRLGDDAKAKAVYAGMTPLVAGDIAECIRWMIAQPDHVNIDRIEVKPRDQAGFFKVNRAVGK